MVKKLLLIRHAESLNKDNTQSLTATGIGQCYRASEDIRDHVIDSNTEIWHSTHQNATETAKFIGSRLGISNFSPKEELISDISHFVDFDWLDEAIEQCKSEVLIIVSHLEYVWYYPVHLGHKPNSATYGELVLINKNLS